MDKIAICHPGWAKGFQTKREENRTREFEQGGFEPKEGAAVIYNLRRLEGSLVNENKEHFFS